MAGVRKCDPMVQCIDGVCTVDPLYLMTVAPGTTIETTYKKQIPNLPGKLGLCHVGGERLLLLFQTPGLDYSGLFMVEWHIPGYGSAWQSVRLVGISRSAVQAMSTSAQTMYVLARHDGGMMRNVIRIIQRQPRSLLTTLGFVLVLCLGVIDYLTGPEISFSVFYLLPIFGGTWFVDQYEEELARMDALTGMSNVRFFTELANIGAVTFTTPPDSVHEMIRQADDLMYAAKRNGKDMVKHEVWNREDY